MPGSKSRPPASDHYVIVSAANDLPVQAAQKVLRATQDDND
jgi:hypothetical protein